LTVIEKADVYEFGKIVRKLPIPATPAISLNWRFRPGGVVRYDARKVCLRLGKRLLVLTDRISIRDLNRHRRATRVSEEVPILKFWRDEGEKSTPYTSSLHE
jgi:hypothetical protein